MATIIPASVLLAGPGETVMILQSLVHQICAVMEVRKNRQITEVRI